MIFLRINLPNSVQFKQYWSKIVSMIEGLGEGATPSKHPPETSGPRPAYVSALLPHEAIDDDHVSVSPKLQQSCVRYELVNAIFWLSTPVAPRMRRPCRRNVIKSTSGGVSSSGHAPTQPTNQRRGAAAGGGGGESRGMGVVGGQYFHTCLPAHRVCTEYRLMHSAVHPARPGLPGLAWRRAICTAHQPQRNRLPQSIIYGEFFVDNACHYRPRRGVWGGRCGRKGCCCRKKHFHYRRY